MYDTKIIFLTIYLLLHSTFIAAIDFGNPQERLMIEEYFEELAIGINKSNANSAKAQEKMLLTLLKQEIVTKVNGVVKIHKFTESNILYFYESFYQYFLDYHEHFNYNKVQLLSQVYQYTYKINGEYRTPSHTSQKIRSIIAENTIKNIASQQLIDSFMSNSNPSNLYLFDFLLYKLNSDEMTIYFDEISQHLLNIFKNNPQLTARGQYALYSWFKILILQNDQVALEKKMLEMFEFLGENIKYIEPFELFFEDLSKFLRINILNKRMADQEVPQTLALFNPSTEKINSDFFYHSSEKKRKQILAQFQKTTQFELFFKSFSKLNDTIYNVGRLKKLKEESYQLFEQLPKLSTVNKVNTKLTKDSRIKQCLKKINLFL